MTVTQLINEACGADLQGTMRATIQETNSVLAGCNVHYLFRGSVIDLETGKNGVRWLIVRLLHEAQAEFPKFNGQDYRNIYLSYGLTSEDIIDRIRAINGSDKYPDQTILDNLSDVLIPSGEVGSIRMTNLEDRGRNNRANKAKRIARGKNAIAKAPRCKYYLIAK
jgi:hypothetical protein